MENIKNNINKGNLLNIGKFIAMFIMAYSLANTADIISFLSHYLDKGTITAILSIMAYTYNEFRSWNSSFIEETNKIEETINTVQNYVDPLSIK